MVDYAEALGYPSKNWTNVIIGGVMLALSFLIVPLFFVMGYLVEVMRNTIAGKPEQPKWQNWGKLFMEGLSLFVVTVVFFIIPVIILIVGLYASWPSLMTAVLTYDYVTLMSTLLFSGPYLLVAGIIMVIAGFLYPMALANYVAKGRIGAALQLGEVWRRIKSIMSDYIVAYLVIIVLSMVFTTVSGFLAITVILPAFIMYYYQVFVWRIYGALYKKSSA